VKPLLVATGNAHKLCEYAALLPGIPLVSLRDFAPAPPVSEDAPDFAGNAIQKARAGHAHTGHPCLADDSGIEVAALGGAPGVHSARYAPGTDADRTAALLAAMQGKADRRARFVCLIALCGLPADAALPAGLIRQGDCVLARGVVEGHLAHAPRGAAGFGYDPVFELPEGRTVAELPEAAKNAISHRGRAARLVLPLLADLFG